MPVFFQIHHQALPVTLESIGNDWPQVYINRPEGYPYYHWLQTENGSGEVWINHHKINLSKGEGILIAPFVPHTYFSNENWKTKFVTFNGDLSQQFYDICQVKTYALANDSSLFNFSEWIDQIVAIHQSKQIDAFVLSSKAYQFLLVFRQLSHPFDTSEHPLFHQFVLPTIKEIETHFAEEITVNSLAKKIFISPQYLNRLFNRFLQQSPYQYLTDFRINQAKEQLINFPKDEIQSIAIRVGFISASQFSHIFKSKTGYTPKQFRELFITEKYHHL